MLLKKKAWDFPIARVGAIISLSCGAVMNLGICRYAGKGQGEVSLLRQLWDCCLAPGDVLLGDRLVANWTGIVMLRERGYELVSRLNKAHRSADFRRGVRVGKDHHIVCWRKPRHRFGLSIEKHTTSFLSMSRFERLAFV